MPLIYFSSSSPFAETFSNKIASQGRSVLEAECIISSFDQETSKQNLKEQIEDCDVLIVVVCSDPGSKGEDVSAYNLIDNEKIRFEIVCAMNKDILIVPVLIDDAKLPERDNVPGALKKLLDCTSHRLRTVFWEEDLENLLEHLEEEITFVNEVKEKLTESVEVNYQRLADLDGQNSKKEKVDLESSDFMQVRKMIEAETIFLQKARGIGDKKAEKNALSALALAYSRLGQTRKAIQYFQEQLKISKEFGFFEEVCGLLANLGDAFAISGNIDRAKSYYEEQRVLAESKGFPAYVGTSYNGLGFVFVKQGKVEEAIDCYFKALESYRELEDHDKQLELLVGIGLNYRKLKNWEKATDCLEQAVEIAKYVENRKEEIQIRVDLAEVYLKLGKRNLCIAQIDRAEGDLKFIKASWADSLVRRIEVLRDL
ncbi:MAG: tetratricopeptide repeat protein [Nitrospinae bacterium]|nr:tetratricopeptide repeat protein [Nitrospinota bacterium]